MEIDWVILADSAEVVANKLYMLGGGWDMLWSNTFPFDRNCAIALAFRVPWNDTNQMQPFRVTIVNGDGAVIGGPVEGHFVVGRPPELSPGSEQRFQLVINVTLHLDEPGSYAVTATVGERSERRVPFQVVKR